MAPDHNDVTERKRAEEALQESEEKFRSLVESINDLFYELDGQGIIKYASPSVERIFGFSQTETVGRSIADFLDAGETVPAIENVRKVMDGDAVPHEYCIRSKSGEIRWIRVSSSPIKKGDQVVGIRGILSDITERKRAEVQLEERNRFLESITATSPDVIYLYHTRQGRHVYINRDLASLLGYSTEEIKKAGAALLLERVHPEDLPAVMKHIETLAHTQSNAVYQLQYRIKGKDDDYLWFFVRELVYQRDQAGQPEILFGIVQVITEQKRTEEELRASREQMRALAGHLQVVREEARTRIAREIHDELGGALTGLKIDFSLLARTALRVENETVRTSLLAGMDSMIESIEAAIQTVRRIAMELRPGILDDLGLTAALEWQLKDFEKRTGIRCEFSPPMDDISLDADLSTALFRIFQEALTNVARHSGATEVRVLLCFDAGLVILEVDDNGKGIHKAEIASKHALGLLGMSERAQIFGGRITVTGTPGTGTKVKVEIPLTACRQRRT